MITEDINILLAKRKSRILDFAQMALQESQFKAFRKLFLHELGNSGFLSDLDRLLANNSHSPERQGKGRNILRKGGGVP
jgi:hypothetical protein